MDSNANIRDDLIFYEEINSLSSVKQRHSTMTYTLAAAGATPSVPAFGGTSPPNPQEKVEIIMPTLYCVFGGEPIESHDGESLEGVGETRLTTGTIFTDKLFTGQREMASLGIYHYGARFYSPKLGRFLSADTIVPGAANPQAYNRYSYVLGNPLRYIDPSGHGQCQTQEDCADMGTTPMGTGGSGGGGGGGDDDEPDLGHDYGTSPTLVCPAVYSCSAQEMMDYLYRFAYPGQDPWSPVQDLHIYTVDPFDWFSEGSYINSGGKIIVDISNGGLTTTNSSLSTHLFHDGKVVRTLSQDKDGAWYVTTRGTGTNDTPVVGSLIDGFNQWVGPGAFTNLDLQMASAIAEHHSP